MQEAKKINFTERGKPDILRPWCRDFFQTSLKALNKSGFLKFLFSLLRSSGAHGN